MWSITNPAFVLYFLTWLAYKEVIGILKKNENNLQQNQDTEKTHTSRTVICSPKETK